MTVRKRTFDSEWTFRATFVRAHDGDTLFVSIDQGLRHFTGSPDSPEPVRIDGINTAEMNDKDKKAKALADKALAFVLERLKPGDRLWIATKKQEGDQLRDKFGRLLGDVYWLPPKPPGPKLKKGQKAPPPAPDEWVCLNDELRDAGLAVEYHGEKRGAFPID